MNTIRVFFEGDLTRALGWTLVHSVWQGVVITAAVAIALVVLRRRSANLRYLVASLGLCTMLVVPVVTYTIIVDGPAVYAAVQHAGASDASVVSTSNVQIADAVADNTGGSRRSVLPLVVAMWFVGVFVLSLHVIVGWSYTQVLRRRTTKEVPEPWRERMSELAKQMGVGRSATLLSSSLVRVPTLVGWLRPVVLVPASVFSGLHPGHVELIIAHELAHIRRHDYIANMLQAACETLLFYHPGVWWISGRMRIERENCCDDLVIETFGDARKYAEALAGLELVRQRYRNASSPKQSQKRFALAASDGSLADRIRRVLEKRNQSASAGGRWLVGGMLLSLFALTILAAPEMSRFWGRLGTDAPVVGPSTDRADATIVTTPPTQSLPQAALDRTLRDWVTGYYGATGYQRTADRLEELIQRHGSEEEVNGSLAALAGLPGDAGMEAWIRIAESHVNPSVRRHAVEWLKSHGNVYAVPTLEHVAMFDEDWSLQVQAFNALRVQPAQRGIPSVVRIARTHSNPVMRIAAISLLGSTGDATARLTLDRALYHDSDEQVQLEALRAINRLASNTAVQLSLLSAVRANHPNPSVRREASKFILDLRSERARASTSTPSGVYRSGQRTNYSGTADKLARLAFEDDDLDTQKEAVRAIANLDPAAAMQPLQRIAASHPDDEVREFARDHVARTVEASVQSARFNEASRVAIIAPAAPDRIAAIRLLFTWDAPVVIQTLNDVAMNDESPAVQNAALKLLSRRSELAANAAIARVARGHHEVEMRMTAVRMLADFPADDAVDVLQELVYSDADTDVRREAIYVLGALPDRVGHEVLQVASENPALSRSLRSLARSALR